LLRSTGHRLYHECIAAEMERATAGEGPELRRGNELELAPKSADYIY